MEEDGGAPRKTGRGSVVGVPGPPRDPKDVVGAPGDHSGSAGTAESAEGPQGNVGISGSGQTCGRRRRPTVLDGEDEQAPRKILAVLRCNFEQAHQKLRNISPKRAYIGQASSVAVFLSQPLIKMIFGGG